jgi:segregation and condensation protein A
MYKRYKEISAWLREIEEQGLQSYVRVAPMPTMARNIDLSGVTLDDLLKSVQLVLDKKPPLPSVDSTVSPVTITISDQIELITRETMARRRVSFRELLNRAETRIEVIVTLLALLEMVKQLRVIMHQDTPFGDIYIEHRQEPQSEAAS